MYLATYGLFGYLRALRAGFNIAFHCDGKVEWAVDDLVGIGADISNPLRPELNDVAAVKRRYGTKLSVWANVDPRQVMSMGTARVEVHSR